MANKSNHISDTISANGGVKTRIYPHEPGQWTTHVYVDVKGEDFTEQIQDVLEQQKPGLTDCFLVDELHVSLFRGHFVLRFHQIQHFIDNLTPKVNKIPKFKLILNRVQILKNDEGTRSFICLHSDPRFQNPCLDRLIHEIDCCLHEFERRDQRENYQDTFITHCSLIWFQGDTEEKQEAVKPLLNSLEQEFEEDPLKLEVDSISVKTVETVNTSTSTKELETPISILQDFCTRRLNGRIPDYQLISQDAPVHKPSFVFRVGIAGVVATASAQSKKKAKQAAALKALDELSRKFDDDIAIKYVNSQKNSPVPIGGQGDQGGQADAIEEVLNEINPVGKLQEVCMKKRWRPPMYNTINEVGLPHERLFTMTCEVDCNGTKVTSKGAGRSKKLAKRSAAVEMIALLETDGTTSSLAKLSLTPSQVKAVRGSANFDPTQTVTLFAGQKVIDFMKGLGDELNHELDMLFNSSNTNVSIMEMIADFLECSVDFHRMPRRDPLKSVFIVSLNPVDQFQCPIPIVTGWGSGSNESEAKEAAARKAVHLLKEIRYIQ